MNLIIEKIKIKFIFNEVLFTVMCNKELKKIESKTY